MGNYVSLVMDAIKTGSANHPEIRVLGISLLLSWILIPIATVLLIFLAVKHAFAIWFWILLVGDVAFILINCVLITQFEKLYDALM